MKVAMIGLRGIPAKSGGVEVVVENLAPLLVKMGIEVTVYCRNPYSDERPSEYKGVTLKYLPTINTKHTEAFVHSFLSSFSADFNDFDIVHYHALGNVPFAAIAKLANKKTVVTLHGLDYEREKWGAAAKTYLKLAERATLYWPDRIVAVSKKIQAHFLKKYKKKIYYIPNGVNLQSAKKIEALKRFGLSKGFILYLGRLVPEKGIHYLIDAYKKSGIRQKLVIAGEPTHTEDYLATLKNLAGDDPRIVFTGPLYGDEKAEAFSNAAFFVLPSTIEGMPIVLLEAMSYGLCPLVSDIEENLELTKKQKYGFTFRSGDSDDLARKLALLARNPQKVIKKGGISRGYITENFTWQQAAAKYYEIYRGAMNDKQ